MSAHLRTLVPSFKDGDGERAATSDDYASVQLVYEPASAGTAPVIWGPASTINVRSISARLRRGFCYAAAFITGLSRACPPCACDAVVATQQHELVGEAHVCVPSATKCCTALCF